MAIDAVGEAIKFHLTKSADSNSAPADCTQICSTDCKRHAYLFCGGGRGFWQIAPLLCLERKNE
jgi:transposase-like protein